MWGINLNYDLGPGPPLVGHSTPDFEFADGGRVGPLMLQGGIFGKVKQQALAVEQLAAQYPKSVRYVSGRVKNPLGLSVLLIRPDGFIAWATGGEVDELEVRAALGRWFGR